MDSERQVGCERKDGLLNVHSENMTCEVCAPESIEGEVPKHKHFFAPGYDTCQCGAQRCSFTISGHRSCKKVATSNGLCRKHSAEADRLAAGATPVFWTADRILDILNNFDKTTILESGKTVKNTFLIYRFLQRMFERQTQDEQASFNTSHDNGIGFAGCDARLLSDMATSSLRFNVDYQNKYGHMNVNGLTDRQASYVASRLKKYVKTQLVVIANEATAAPMPEAVTVQTIQTALNSPVQFAEHSVQAKVEKMREWNSKRYYDPFDEGEPLTEDAAREFWTKRFIANPDGGVNS